MGKQVKTLKDIKQHKRNANKGTVRGGEVVRQSLQEVGPWRSIGVDRNGVVGVGNKTGAAWQEMASPDDVIVVQTTGDKLVVVQRMDLDLEADDPAVKARSEKAAIYDNRASQLNLDWEWTILKDGFDPLGLDSLFVPSEIFTAGELLAQQATDFLDHVDVTPPAQAAPASPAGAAPPPSGPSVAPAPDPADIPTVQGPSAVGYAAAAALPHHPHSQLDGRGDATSPYTVLSFATSLKQRDFILKALAQARDDNGFDNTTTALIWLCSEYLGETLD